MKMTWVNLKSGDTHTSGYVEYDKRVKPGVKVQLKDDDKWWDVESVGEIMERTPFKSETWYQTNFVRKDGHYQSNAWQGKK